MADWLGADDVGGLLRANLDQEVGALQTLEREADRIARAAVEERSLEL